MYLLAGFAVGFIINDALNLLGLHWLTWPVITLLVVFAVGVFIQGRRDDRRDNSGDDGI